MAGEVVLIDPQTGLSYRAGSGSGPAATVADPSYSRVEGTQANGATANPNPIVIACRTSAGVIQSLAGANDANGTPGAGLLGAGMLGFDGTNNLFRRLAVGPSGAAIIAGSSGTPIDSTVGADGSGSLQGLVAASRGQVFNGTTWDRARGGPTASARLASTAASVNATLASATARVFYVATGQNTNAAARYLKIYDKATAPTVGTDVPIWVEYLPPSSKFSISLPSPMRLANGLAYAITTGVADTDTGALTAGDILALNLGYSA